jgi:NAD(P)-dependent dehydrogenase (short-subunit alcohol dehydrogenase family)
LRNPPFLFSQFATNHLAHYLLTELLLPVIKQSAPARIINLSSRAMYSGVIHFDDIQLKKKYNSWTSYHQSKLANVLYSGYLARQLKGTGVVVAVSTVNCYIANALKFLFF